MNNNIILFLVILLLVSTDKVSTYYSIHNLQKNYPGIDYLSAEKNPLAKWFMQKAGLIGGQILFAFISIGLFYLSLYLIQSCLKGFHVANYIGISWYVMLLVYSFTIGNNIYFALKHGRILP